jgi:hypothetical protein
MYAIELIVGAFVVLAAICVVVVIGYVVYYYAANGLFAPTRREMAKVLWKRDREYDVDVPRGVIPMVAASVLPLPFRFLANFVLYRMLRFNGEQPICDSMDFFITFDIGDKHMEFAVPMDVFADTQDGDEGLLVYKGAIFKEFITGVTADKVREVSP